MSIEYTGVKATDEEVAQIVRMAKHAQNTPVILMGKIDVSAEAWQAVNKACHTAALGHGLPEIPGYYGLDPERKEFIKGRP